MICKEVEPSRYTKRFVFDTKLFAFDTLKTQPERLYMAIGQAANITRFDSTAKSGAYNPGFYHVYTQFAHKLILHFHHAN